MDPDPGDLPSGEAPVASSKRTGRGNRKRSANKRRKQSAQKAAAKPTKVCFISGKEARYRDPKTELPYHSLVEFKEIRRRLEAGELQPASKAPPGETSASSAVGKSKYLRSNPDGGSDRQASRRRRRASQDSDDSNDDEPGWNITEDMKTRLRDSSWLKKELRDGGLRQLIEQIDGASDDDGEKNSSERQMQMRVQRNRGVSVSPRELELARTRHTHTKFASFIDKLLLTAGVLQPADGRKSEGIESLLEEPGQLVLAPIPRRKACDDSDAGEGGQDDESGTDGESSSGSEDEDSDSSQDCSSSDSSRSESD